MASSRRAPTSDNISTYHSAGTGSPDYTSMGTWEAATDNDLVTATQGETLLVWNGTHDDNVALLGATVNSSYFRRIIGDTGSPGVHHGGLRGMGSILSTTYDSGNPVSLDEQYASIQDLCMTGALNSANARYLIDMSEANQDVVGCVIYGLSNAGAGTFRTIVNRNPDNSIINTIIENCEGNAGVGDLYNIQSSGTPLNVSNCTFYGTGALGVRADTANLTKFTNVILDGYTVCVSGTISSSGSDYMLTSDSTAVGANSVTTGNPAYVNEGGNDYHLATGDTSGAKTGVDPTAYDEDIDLDPVTTWWMGANSLSQVAPVNTVPDDTLGIFMTSDSATQISSVSPSTAISVVDAAGLTTCRVYCTSGDLTVTLSGSVVISAGANGSSDLTLGSGASTAEFNTVLATLTYQGDADFHGTDTINVVSTGTGGSDTDTFDVLNDPRSLTLTVNTSNFAALVTATASTQIRLDSDRQSGSCEVTATDDDALTDVQTLVFKIAPSQSVFPYRNLAVPTARRDRR